MSSTYAFRLLVSRLLGFTVGQWDAPTMVIAIIIFGGLEMALLGLLRDYIAASFNQAGASLAIAREGISFK